MSDSDTQSIKPSKRRFPIWFILLIIILLGLTFFGERGLLHIWRANQQLADLEKQLQDQEQVNAELRQEIDSLRSDLQTIESLARRELGMVRENERVYQFPPEDQAGQSAKPTNIVQ
jgi:cell division protein FtsB